MAKTLTENRKKQLDQIVSRMIYEKRPDKEIQMVVDDFKSIHAKGFLGNFAREVALPIKKGIQNIRAGVDRAKGESFLEATQPRMDKFVGPVSPLGVQGQRGIQQAKELGQSVSTGQRLGAYAQDFAESAGAGLEIGSNLPFGKAIGATAKIGTQIAKQGLKQYATRQGGKELGRQALNMGIETGVGSGLYTLGRGIQEQTPVGQLAKETALSTGLGFGAGAVLGAGGAIAGTGIRQGFRGVKNIGTQTERLRGAIGTPTKELEQREINRLERDFESLFDEKKSTIKKNDILSRFGQSPARVFAEAGYIPKVEGNKIRTDDFIESATDFIAENAQGIQKVLDAYDNVNPRSALSYADFRNNALKKIESNPDFAGKVSQISAKLDEFIKDYKNATKTDKLSVGQLNRLRVQSNVNTKKYKFTDPDKGLVDDLDNVIGDTVREVMIEKNISPTINQINQEIGKLIKARAMARYINGNTVNGGALSNMLVSLGAGGITAVATGGSNAITRAFLSAISAFGARQVMDVIRSMKFGGIIRKRILRNIGLNKEVMNKLLRELPEIERRGLIKEIQSILKETPQLSAPKEGAVRKQFGSGKTLNLPARTESTIAKQTKNLGQQNAFGGFAGIEQDEDGNLTFNPEKAVAGMLAMGTITSKQGDEFIKKFKDKAVKVVKDIPYKGESDLTTKILKDLEGKTTVSKQYILDATNRGELKQVERDLIRQVLDDMDNGKKYVYHGTSQGAFKNIMKEGIVPQRRGLSSFSKTEEYSRNWAFPPTNTKGVMLRIKEDVLKGKTVRNNTKVQTDKLNEVLTKETIPPEAIEVLKDGKWVPLTGKSDTINVSDFAKKVKAELLPLKVKTTSNPKGSDPKFFREQTRGDAQYGGARMQPRYEMVNLPDELRGNVKNYRENIYESPIKTSAGETHFGGKTDNYFGHTRIEDMADNKTRRVIEVQSDLYQKGNLEREVADRFDPAKTQLSKEKADKLFNFTKRLSGQGENLSTKEITEYRKLFDEAKTLHENTVVAGRNKELSKLQQYNDPTAHFRMIREEIKKAAQDGKTKLQFPTGETAMKIEGLGQSDVWSTITDKGTVANLATDYAPLKPGMTVFRPAEDRGNDWIITDVIGDGKFKAVPKSNITSQTLKKLQETGKLEGTGYTEGAIEQFDISGKVDTNNPIFKFYEKEVSKYLNKFGGKRVIDDNGVSWIEVPIKKEWAKMPVEAFAFAPLMINNDE